MPRGYRHILFALVGWLSLAAASEPQNVARPKESSAEQTTAQALSNIAATYDRQAKDAERSRETEPCEKGDDKRYSDLCARWKAADAASLSAWLGWISLVGVVAALLLNAHSNWIASTTSRQQLRAYMVNKSSGYAGINNDAEFPTYSYEQINAGETPAYDYRARIRAYIETKDHVPPPFTALEISEKSPSICGPGQITGAFMNPLKSTATERANKIAGTHLVFIVAGTDYRDVFGRHYRYEAAYKSMTSVTVNMATVFCREYRIRGPNWRWWHFWNRYPE